MPIYHFYVKDEYVKIFDESEFNHAWLSGGSSSFTNWDETVYYTFWERYDLRPFGPGQLKENGFGRYTYMIWGWDPNYNGFFSDYAMSSPVSSKIKDIKYFSVEPPK